MIATRLVWDAAGQPSPAAASVAKLIVDHPAQCGMCGEYSDRTANTDRALGANFSDRSLFRYPGGRTCPACLWCCSGKPPATLRMWSIIAAPGATLPASAEKAWLRTPGLLLHNRAGASIFGHFLAEPSAGPWVCSIAISAQKHVIPYAKVNHGNDRWAVRVEDHDVTATPGEWRNVRDQALALRRLGVPQQAVLDGEPAFIKTRAQLAEWAALNTALRGYLQSPLLDFALWTITKEEIKS